MPTADCPDPENAGRAEELEVQTGPESLHWRDQTSWHVSGRQRSVKTREEFLLSDFPEDWDKVERLPALDFLPLL